MAKWDKTDLSKKRLEKQIETMDGVDYFQGRPVISRNTPVDGGVYTSAGPSSPAIVVDSEKYPEINNLYKRAKKTAKNRFFDDIPPILHAVYATVDEVFSHRGDDKSEELEKSFKSDQKVTLDVFIKKGIGVCKHFALTSAALLEKFRREGLLKGKISLDRNTMEEGGHAWCRYTDPKGEVYILDLAQGFLGTLEDSDGKAKWSYRRPGESS